MPYSEKQRKLAWVALKTPEKVYKRNKSILGMTKEELMDFAKGEIIKKRKGKDGKK